MNPLEQRISPVQMIGEAYDQPPPQIPPQAYLLCAGPRTGSYFLCRVLHALGIGLPHEYFNATYSERFVERHDLTVEEALRDPLRYWRLLEQTRSQNGWVGSKLQFPQLVSFFASGALNPVLRSARFIYLYRRDLHAQAQSWRKSLSTGTWAFDGVVTTKPQPQIGSYAAHMSRLIRALASQDASWRSFFAEYNIHPHWMAYEDLIEQPERKMAELCAYLGCALDVARLQAYLRIERPQSRKASTDAEHQQSLWSLEQGRPLAIGRTAAARPRRRR